jgi:hypothetical protein
MRRTLRLALAVFVVAVLAGLTWPILHPRSREPVYEGKPASYWIAQLPSSIQRVGPPLPAEVALTRMMPAALPALLKALNNPDPDAASRAAMFLGDVELTDDRVIKALVQKSRITESATHRAYRIIWQKLPNAVSARLPKPEVPQSFRNRNGDYWYRRAAPSFLAFHQLLRAARRHQTNDPRTITPFSRAVPDLCHTLRAREDWASDFAAKMLGRLRTDAKTAVPALIRELYNTNRDPEVRVAICLALGETGSDSPEATKALVSAAQGPNRLLQCAGILALAKCTPSRDEAVPLLRQVWSGNDKLLRYLAYQTLRDLEPAQMENIRPPEPITPSNQRVLEAFAGKGINGVSYFYKMLPAGGTYDDYDLFLFFACEGGSQWRGSPALGWWRRF